MRIKLLKIKKKTVKLIVSSLEGIHLYTGVVKKYDDFVEIRQVVAGEFTGNIFTFSKSLIRMKQIDDTVNYYINEKDVRVGSK